MRVCVKRYRRWRQACLLGCGESGFPQLDMLVYASISRRLEDSVPINTGVQTTESDKEGVLLKLMQTFIFRPLYKYTQQRIEIVTCYSILLVKRKN